jgi:hypothetical protein
MPELSRFYGIVIFMIYDDHPPAHFHARYGDDAVSVSLDEATRVDGRFPRRALSLVLDWADHHRDELLENWLRAQRGESLKPIAPLE